MEKVTVYIDMTGTVISGFNTGIQRVVRNISSESLITIGDVEMTCIPVLAMCGDLYEIGNALGNKKTAFWIVLRNGLVRFKSWLLKSVSIIAALEGTAKKRTDEGGILHSAYYLMRLMYVACKRVIKKLITFFAVRQIRRYAEKIEVRDGDIILLADAYWDGSIVEAVKKLRREGSGAYIAQIIYDLIPINTPEFCDAEFAETFQKEIDETIPLLDSAIGISKDVKEQLDRYIVKKSLKKIATDYFYLGADFSRKTKNELLREWPEQLWGGDVLLMVGTIEPRKGHDYVIDAMEILWSRGSEKRLLIVGKIGWKCGGTIQRINNHPQYNCKLFHLTEINDSELAYCYEKSEAIILASYEEGFGLPLVEAMTYRKQVIASDIPIFREIGGDFPVYFTCGDPIALVDAISSLSCIQKKKIDESFTWLTWDESRKMLFSTLLKINNEARFAGH